MMIWIAPFAVYLLINVLMTLKIRHILSRRISNEGMRWLFSISLSLSINFLLALLLIAIIIRVYH